MSNHWHLLLCYRQDGELPEVLRSITVTPTKRWYTHDHRTETEPVYQDRFTWFPILTNAHFLTAILDAFYACGVTGCSIDAQGNRVVGTPDFAAAGLYNKSTPGVSVRSRSELIEKHLANRELSPIEGVWIGSSNNYEGPISIANIMRSGPCFFCHPLTSWSLP